MGKRDILIVTAAILAAVILSLGQFFWQTVETGSWGLSFQTQGQTPQGPLTVERLKAYDAVYAGDPAEKVLYLTFDAGYENGQTEKILDTLNKHNAQGTFFLVGNYIDHNRDLVRRMVEEGHIVANHTMHHPDMQNLSAEKFTQELQELETLFQEVTGKELPKFYRPPQGNYSEENLKTAQKLGYRTVFWSLAYADWDNQAQPDPEAALEKLLSRTHNGAVVLLHSTSATNGKILDQLLTRWEEMGYRFGSLPELF